MRSLQRCTNGNIFDYGMYVHEEQALVCVSFEAWHHYICHLKLGHEPKLIHYTLPCDCSQLSVISQGV